MPQCSASRGDRGAYSSPLRSIRPKSGGRFPPSRFIKVDLPAPFSPTSPRVCPGARPKVTSLSTFTPKKLFSMPSNCRIELMLRDLSDGNHLHESVTPVALSKQNIFDEGLNRHRK